MTVPLADRLALSCAEAGQLTGLSEGAVRNLVKAGQLCRLPHTARVLIARVELDRWMASSVSVPS